MAWHAQQQLQPVHSHTFVRRCTGASVNPKVSTVKVKCSNAILVTSSVDNINLVTVTVSCQVNRWQHSSTLELVQASVMNKGVHCAETWYSRDILRSSFFLWYEGIATVEAIDTPASSDLQSDHYLQLPMTQSVRQPIRGDAPSFLHTASWT